MTVTGVDFVSVPTQDLERAVRFYGETLGLERSVYKPERNFAEFETGTVTLSVVNPVKMGIGEFKANSNHLARMSRTSPRPARPWRPGESASTATSSTPASATWRSSAIPTATP